MSLFISGIITSCAAQNLTANAITQMIETENNGKHDGKNTTTLYQKSENNQTKSNKISTPSDPSEWY